MASGSLEEEESDNLFVQALASSARFPRPPWRGHSDKIKMGFAAADVRLLWRRRNATLGGRGESGWAVDWWPCMFCWQGGDSQLVQAISMRNNNDWGGFKTYTIILPSGTAHMLPFLFHNSPPLHQQSPLPVLPSPSPPSCLLSARSGFVVAYLPEERGLLSSAAVGGDSSRHTCFSFSLL